MNKNEHIEINWKLCGKGIVGLTGIVLVRVVWVVTCKVFEHLELGSILSRTVHVPTALPPLQKSIRGTSLHQAQLANVWKLTCHLS